MRWKLVEDIRQTPSSMRHIFPSGRVPRLSFAGRPFVARVPPAAWCVDTTLGHGRAVLQLEASALQEIGEQLERLDDRSGMIQRIDLRVEGGADRAVLQEMMARYWRGESRIEPVPLIRPASEEIAALEGVGLREVALPFPVSDFLLAEERWPALSKAVSGLLELIDACLELKLRPRLDLVDVTRTDDEVLLLPILEAVFEHLEAEGRGGGLRLRLCDSLGLGLPWSEAPLPRSVPRLIDALHQAFGLQADQLEFQGNDDLGLALANSLAAVASGCSGVVGALGGAGERSGLAPTEHLLVHLSGLFGTECDLTRVEPLLATLGERGLRLDPRHPLWGEETRRPLDSASITAGQSVVDGPLLLGLKNS